MRLGSIRLSLVLAAAFFIGGGLPHARSDETAPMKPMIRLMAATELKAVDNGHFVTEAEINRHTIRVLVDTGASAVALSYEDAQAAGLHPNSLDFDVPVATANGVTKAARVMLDQVEIDGVGVSDVEGMVMPRGAMEGSLLGMSFLGKLRSFKVEDGVLHLKN
jgi:aspartyl protease family protein